MVPRASIIIPLLRQRDEWLRRAAASALDQTVAAEVIVIVSPHTPPSNLAVLEELAARKPRVSGTRLVVAPRTGTGFPNGVNTGIRLATTGRAGLLLSDDWLEPDAIAQTVVIDADIVSTGAMRYDAAGVLLPHLRRALDPRRYAQLTTNESRASYLTHFLLFRTSRLEEVGGLDETLGDAPGIDDYDLVWTLLEYGATVGMTTEPFYNFTIHDGERLTMRNREEQLRTLARIFDKHGFVGEARERRLEEHARWFGRPEDVVWQELRTTADPPVPQPGTAPHAQASPRTLFQTPS
jgi:glycosyltransferase involved in cell wall biosynthesis